MSDRKQLVILYGVVLAVVVGGTIWMSHEINSRVTLERPTSAVDIQAFCTEALQPVPEFCDSNVKTPTDGTYGGLRVVNNYGEQVTADSSVLTGGDVVTGCLVLTNEGACNEY